ncbi:MAG: hypothetical protein KKE57_05115 [Proteobacteria bacterium]|nr:hypothetical protein [Pseudomonadota bacterium]
MRVRRGYARTIGLGLLAFYLAFAWSCESKDRYAGLYVAVKKDASPQEEISLQLKPNGEGLWIVGDKEVSFSWYIKRGDLRINTKEGGVLVGKLEDSRIRINLPVRGEMLFKKTQ